MWKKKKKKELWWEAYVLMFEECSIEVYKTMGSVWVEEEGEQNAKRMSSII